MYVEILIVQYSTASWDKPHYFVLQLQWRHCTLRSLKYFLPCKQIWHWFSTTPEPALSSQPETHGRDRKLGLLRGITMSSWQDFCSGKRKTKWEVFHDNRVFWKNKSKFLLVAYYFLQFPEEVSLLFSLNLRPHLITQNAPPPHSRCVINYFWKKVK